MTSTAYFIVALDAVVVITALPAYGIAFAAGIITAAALGDRFERRKVFSIGLVLFTVASVACALAPNASELIAARTVQGVGGAIVLPLSLVGVGLVTAGVVALVWALSRANELGWSSAEVVGTSVAGAALLALRLAPGRACFRSSRRRCSSPRSPGLSPTGSAGDRSSSSG